MISLFDNEDSLLAVDHIGEFAPLHLARLDVSASVKQAVANLHEVQELEPLLRVIMGDDNITPHNSMELADLWIMHASINSSRCSVAFILKGRSYKTIKLKDISHQIIKALSLNGLKALVLVYTNNILDECRNQFIKMCMISGVQPLFMDGVDCARLFVSRNHMCRYDGAMVVNGKCKHCDRSSDLVIKLFAEERSVTERGDLLIAQEISEQAPWMISAMRLDKVAAEVRRRAEISQCSLEAFIKLSLSARERIRAMTYRQWHTFWLTPLGTDYLATNCLALERGVSVNRIFLFDESSSPEELASYCELVFAHEMLGIECRITLYDVFAEVIKLPFSYFSSMGRGKLAIFEIGATGIKSLIVEDDQMQLEADYVFDQIFRDDQVTMSVDDFVNQRSDVQNLCSKLRVQKITHAVRQAYDRLRNLENDG